MPEKNWKKFYVKRIVRIYPLFAIAIILTIFVFKSPFTLFQFFFIRSPYWFIDAIVYCYLLTPLFIAIIDRLTAKNFVFSFTAATAALAIFSYFEESFNTSTGMLDYRYVILSFFLAYTGGMALLKYQDEIIKMIILEKIGLFTGLFIMFLYLSRTNLGYAINEISGFCFIITSILFVASIIKSRCLENASFRILAVIGSCSLALYLFQPIFYNVIYRITSNNIALNVIWVILLFPLFIGICYLADKWISRLNKRSWIIS